MQTFQKHTPFGAHLLLGILFLFATLSVEAESISRELYCSTGDEYGLQLCDTSLLQQKGLKQILFLPTGYTLTEKDDFLHFVRFAKNESSNVHPWETPWSPFTYLHRDKILYIAAWVPGGELESENANFDAKSINNPLRTGNVLNTDRQLILQEFQNIQSQFPDINPDSIYVAFNTPFGTSNATTSGLLEGFEKTGLVNITRNFIIFTFIHEGGHAFFNWKDEYIESSLENINVRLLDLLSPLIFVNSNPASVTDGINSLLNIYDMNLSELLYSGSSNVALSQCPVTVGLKDQCGTDVYEEHHNHFETEGAYFGRGIFKDNEYNIMDDSGLHTHSRPQKEDISIVFDKASPGPNDQLRNAGPLINLPIGIGKVEVLAFDNEKHARFHPTTAYDVEVRWEETQLGICYYGLLPYPCSKGDKAKSFRKTFPATPYNIPIVDSSLNSVVSEVVPILCNLLPEMEFCKSSVDEIRDSITDSVEQFQAPYQKMTVPMPFIGKNHYWRFRTHNGSMCDISCEDDTIEECLNCSGWTNFSPL